MRLCYGVLENYGYLGLCLDSVAKKRPKFPVALAMKISLYARLFSDMPPSVCVNEAVELVKLLGKGEQKNFVNAALRAFDPQRVVLPEGEEGLAIRSNFPPFAVREIVKTYGPRAESILLARSGGVSVRFVRGEKAYLAQPHVPTPFPHLYLFEKFTRDEGFFRGDYTFQSVGSVAICGVVEPCARLLDACAAPGGKSVLLAEKCGSVVACDVHPHRVALIESYVARMGAANVEARLLDSSSFEPAFEAAFEGVLVDAPCSGLGTVAENPDLPLRKEEGGMPALKTLQIQILENCARYVKPGGTLYYSTCSILREENDGAVSAFLKAHGEFSAEAAESPLPHEKTECGLQFLPDAAYGAGFYVAKLRRRNA